MIKDQGIDLLGGDNPQLGYMALCAAVIADEIAALRLSVERIAERTR